MKLRVDFQIVHSYDCIAVKNKLLTLLKETLEDEYIEMSNEEIQGKIEINYDYKNEDEFITGFSLFLDEDKEKSEIINTFGDKLQDCDEIHLVVKFFDEDMYEQFKQYSKEIFEIEMKLREAISFIFMDIYENDCYNLLDCQKVKPIIKGIKDEKKQNYLKDKSENEFFYLTFNQYRSLNIPDIIKGNTLIKLLDEANSNDDLKNHISNLGIFNKHKQYYKDFLSGINEDLESIEDLRNCIAHNRSIRGDIRENYEHAKDKFKKSIDAFFERMENRTKLYLIGKIPWEDGDSRGKEGKFETLDNEHIVALLNVEFERAYLLVFCEKCGTANLLIAEDIEPVGGEERGMGMEILHSSHAYSDCVNCNGNMEARITIWEYPEGIFQFFEIDEEENCKHSDVCNLTSLIEDVIRAHEYREEENCKHPDIGNLDSLIEDVIRAHEYREEE